MDELKSEVISAEIINVHRDINPELEFDIVRTIAQDDLEELLIEFSQITFTFLIGNPQITDGEALKLNYIDRYEIISSNTMLTHYFIDEKRQQDDLYSQPDFESFILKWKMI